MSLRQSESLQSPAHPRAAPVRAHLNLPGLAVLVLASLSLAACSGSRTSGPGDLAQAMETRLSVNTYLWRAALETISFMPISQAEAANGIILTDWYTNPQVASERMKVTILVLDQDLRADALKVTALRQQARDGVWVDVPVRAGTAQKLEEAILTRARSIRQAAVGQSEKG